MANANRNAVVGQSGGPTSVINATLAGIIKGAYDSGCIDLIYGMKNGIDGFIKEDLISLDFLNDKDLSLLSLTPSGALGSCRYKIPNDKSLYEKIFTVFEKYRIGYFFYIGGNDSMDTVAKLSAYATENGIDVKIVGVPKTVDNDLVLTDHTPGFGSAAKYVATATLEIARDILSYNKPCVTLIEVMGRDTGWLTCAAALPMDICGVGCDLIYLPEANFSTEAFLSDIDKALSQKNNVLCAVSEGVALVKDNTRGTDQFGHIFLNGTGKYLESLVRRSMGVKSRGIELSLMQRCSGHLASKTDVEESYKIGYEAVKLAQSGMSGITLGFEREKGEYRVDITYSLAKSVANRTKYLPKSFINITKNGVTNKCIEYLYPLIQGETDVKYEKGLPLHYRF